MRIKTATIVSILSLIASVIIPVLIFQWGNQKAELFLEEYNRTRYILDFDKVNSEGNLENNWGDYDTFIPDEIDIYFKNTEFPSITISEWNLIVEGDVDFSNSASATPIVCRVSESDSILLVRSFTDAPVNNIQNWKPDSTGSYATYYPQFLKHSEILDITVVTTKKNSFEHDAKIMWQMRSSLIESVEVLSLEDAWEDDTSILSVVVYLAGNEILIFLFMSILFFTTPYLISRILTGSFVIGHRFDYMTLSFVLSLSSAEILVTGLSQWSTVYWPLCLPLLTLHGLFLLVLTPIVLRHID